LNGSYPVVLTGGLLVSAAQPVGSQIQEFRGGVQIGFGTDDVHMAHVCR